MTKHKLDQLFKDKLANTEIEPSSAALEKFQKKISGKKKPVIWFYAAASISLLLVASIWFLNNNESKDPGITTNEVLPSKTETTPLDLQSVEEQWDSEQLNRAANPISILEVKEKNFETSEKEDVRQKRVIAKPDEIEIEQSKVLIAERTVVIEESKSLDARIEEKLEIIDGLQVVEAPEPEEIIEETPEVSKPLPKVKITYISGRKKSKSLLAESKTTADSTNVKDGTFNRILNSARNIANGSLIADLRDAKENFFNKNDD